MLSFILIQLVLLLKLVKEKTAEVNKTDEIQEGKHEYMKIQNQALFYILGLNVSV